MGVIRRGEKSGTTPADPWVPPGCWPAGRVWGKGAGASVIGHVRACEIECVGASAVEYVEPSVIGDAGTSGPRVMKHHVARRCCHTVL
jgi:hypothetical protein